MPELIPLSRRFIDRVDIGSGMPHPFAPSRADRTQLKVDRRSRLVGLRFRHRKQEYAVTLSRIGQRPIDVLGERNLPVVGADPPFLNQNIPAMLADSSLVSFYDDLVPVNRN